jgi:hypothetical protein
MFTLEQYREFYGYTSARKNQSGQDADNNDRESYFNWLKSPHGAEQRRLDAEWADKQAKLAAIERAKKNQYYEQAKHFFDTNKLSIVLERIGMTEQDLISKLAKVIDEESRGEKAQVRDLLNKRYSSNNLNSDYHLKGFNSGFII